MFGALTGSTTLLVSGMQWRSHPHSPSTAACSAEDLPEVLLHSAVLARERRKPQRSKWMWSSAHNVPCERRLMPQSPLKAGKPSNLFSLLRWWDAPQPWRHLVRKLLCPVIGKQRRSRGEGDFKWSTFSPCFFFNLLQSKVVVAKHLYVIPNKMQFKCLCGSRASWTNWIKSVPCAGGQGQRPD